MQQSVSCRTNAVHSREQRMRRGRGGGDTHQLGVAARLKLLLGKLLRSMNSAYESCLAP